MSDQTTDDWNPIPPEGCTCGALWTVRGQHGKPDCPYLTKFKDRPEYNIPVDSHHPSADDAMFWLKQFMRTNPKEYLMIKESIYSTALSGNALSNYCVGTIERLVAGESVSDRYLLGLAWLVRSMADKEK